MRHALVLPDRGRRRILLVPGPRGWALPSVSLGRDHPGSVDEVIAAIQHRYEIRVSVLRTLARPRDPRSGAFNAALELERLDDRAPRARGGRWVSRAALAARAASAPSAAPRLRRADDRAALAAWLARGRRRAAWMRPGWRERALRWAERRVGARAAHVTQLRAWEGSSVLRLDTKRGAFYLKAVEPPCEHEPGLTRWLARRFPTRVAPVVAVGSRGHWLLMRAVAGPSLRNSARLSDWTRAAREYGRLQRALAGSRALPGVLRGRQRDLPWLGRQITPMLADPSGLAAGGRARLTRGEIARLRRLAPVLRERCRALARLDVPLALDHGDLWAVNVVVGRRGPVFLDWEDAVLGHPFWGVFMLPWSHGFWDRWGHRSKAAARVREAYLAGWAGGEGAARYREAFELSGRLASLYHAAIWWHDVLPYLTTSLETAALVPFFLRRVLEASRG